MALLQKAVSNIISNAVTHSPAQTEISVKLTNAIKLTNKFQKKEKSLDKGKKMCGKALKTRLIFRGRAHEIHS